ncbi:MAG: hypothetical protein JSW16_09185 [Dehalococcoidales bacterium]|nr:MAG: hypothetical protein JSW16_09185 [Dehalococcoidales bacterium]
MKTLLLDCLVLVLVVVITELFWLGKADLAWLITGYALAVALQFVPLLIYKGEIDNG